MDRRPLPRLRAVMSAALATALVVFVVFIETGDARAQAPVPLRLPRASPAASIALDVGPATITVKYQRPALKGRDPWKELGDTGAVWRLGADEATTLTLTEPATLGGKPVAAGTYALFARVTPKRWTLLVNKVANQWGAFAYDPKQDVAAIDLVPTTIPKREWFSIGLDPKGNDGATLTIAWDTQQVACDLSVDVEAAAERQIEHALANLGAKDVETRLQIVKYRVTRNEELEQALKLAEEAVAIDSNYWTLEWNARTLFALGDKEAAAPLLERALADARGKTPDVYVQALTQLLKEWKK